ncbi:MAG: serine/threonine protein kinase [Rhodothermia bacterium]|nr:serine/threonine protein kinase [Rhodothermia bacterium]
MCATGPGFDDDSVRRLFDAALQRTGLDRWGFLSDACEDDSELRREVASLLEAADKSDVLDFLPEVVPQDPAQLLTGRRVSHFLIGEKLGGGGMGVVYKAQDTRLDRVVAIKFLPGFLSAFSEWRDNFIQEARCVSSLDHPNIAVVHEVDTTPGGQPFIAMAFYDGETLKKTIARGPIPCRQAVLFSIQIASGLAHAHDKGIVHRDIKPANIMIVDGHIRIVDFGLSGVTRSVMGKQGLTAGTTAYMSPEQTLGEPTDGRTDIWSLGVLLYEMLSGRKPFVGAGTNGTIAAIRTAPPEPLHRAIPGRKRRVWAVVRKCLAKDPRDRYQSAGDVAGGLRSAMVGLPMRLFLSTDRNSI